jgi:hypothetical protein
MDIHMKTLLGQLQAELKRGDFEEKKNEDRNSVLPARYFT